MTSTVSRALSARMAERTSPAFRQGTGPDAAVTAWPPAVATVSETAGEGGAWQLPSSPALTCGPDCPHPDRCAFEHAALMDRLTTYA